MAVCIYYLPGIIWIYLRHDRELWIQSRWDPVPTKDMSTNLSARISQRAHIKYFIQFGVSPLLPLLAHHTEGHLCFMLFSDECTKWNVTLSPWIWHLSRWVCWPQGQLITPVWIWTSWATVHPLAGTLPHRPNVWSRGYKGNAHTQNSKARPSGLVLLYLNIGISIEAKGRIVWILLFW